LTQDIVRGETFQINHPPLLQSLQRTYPEDGWDLRKLRLKIADLVRDALRVQEVLASDDLVLFGRNRETKVGAEKNSNRGLKVSHLIRRSESPKEEFCHDDDSGTTHGHQPTNR